MARNIIFIILFVLIYGGLFLFFSSKSDEPLTDRNNYGTFDDRTYNCDRFSMKMEFSDDWLVYDGVTMKDIILSLNSEADIYDTYGASLDELAFIVGAFSPDATVQTIAYTDYNYKEQLTESYIDQVLDSNKDYVEMMGGTVNSASCHSLLSNGTGSKMIMYYIDYEIDGVYGSYFECYTNSGKDAVFFQGTYENASGLTMLMDFVKENVTYYGNTSAAV